MARSNQGFLSIGFRPFYLGAALFALLAVPLWLAVLLSGLQPVIADPLHWHRHEMVFGFAAAVIVGFLLTAVRNWSGRPTPSGWSLGALFGLWMAARVLNFTMPGPFAASADLSFFLVTATLLGLPLWRAKNRRNAFVVVLLVALGVASTIDHAASQGLIAALPPGQATVLALDLILILMVVIGGRIIPAFSANAIAGLQPRTWPLLEGLVLISVLSIFLLDAAQSTSRWLPLLFCGAAILHSIRLLAWKPWKTWRNPLLLALPLAYAWIPVHLILRVAAPTAAIHALTIGAMAGLMLAMMTRSALGHTGRPLQAGPIECLCFAAIHGAALFRLCAVWDMSHYLHWLIAAGLSWTFAFGAFVVGYWPILTRDRIPDV